MFRKRQTIIISKVGNTLEEMCHDILKQAGEEGLLKIAFFCNAANDSGGILQKNGFQPSDIYRQWNYIQHITAGFDGGQNYQEFNDARSIFYAGSDWSNGYPAATGIGTSAGGRIGAAHANAEGKKNSFFGSIGYAISGTFDRIFNAIDNR